MTTRRRVSTVVASAGVGSDPAYGSLTPPLWTSDTYEWADPQEKPSYDYSRTVNPNRDIVAAALAELEGAAGGVLTNSGQSAALLALLLVPPGGVVVAPHDCYGGTYRLIAGLEEKRLVRARFVDQADDAAFERAMDEKPALLWLETPSNPLLRVVDVARRAAQAKAAGALTVADNTLLTPCRQRPLALGCDLVMHSTTKALNGHSDLFGGALLLSDPELLEKAHWWANAAGLSASAHDAWQTLRGLRTLPLRVDRQEASAREIAAWLSRRSEVAAVHYPGLESDPGYELAARQQDGPGLMLSFRVKGGGAATKAFLDALQLITLASSLGGFSSLICVPSTMTHRGMPPEAQAEAGIDAGLLRLSVGLEAPVDLVADIERGLTAIA
ncbi:MAG: PLP-dependent transferase [Pseudomonadota bacterium]|nr:PLP-dependent transferase [Pseudomonadota bacterium]